jgi:opacity protein-like surface antigen
MPMNGVGLRGEFEVGYRPSLVAPHAATNPANGTVLSTTSHVRDWTTMLNAYADFDAGIGIKPYLGGGLGIGFNHVDTLTYAFNGTTSGTEPGKNKSSFAWSLMAGFSYAMTEMSNLDIRYRYLDAGKVESSGVVTLFNGYVSTFPGLSSHLKTHEITIGVRVGF